LRFFEVKETLSFISRAIFSRKKRKALRWAAQRAGRLWRHVRAQKEEHSLLRNVDYQSLPREFKIKRQALEAWFIKHT